MVEVPEPGAGMGLGLKVAYATEDKVTAESKPPVVVEVTVTVPEAPRAMVIPLGDVLRVKLPVLSCGKCVDQVIPVRTAPAGRQVVADGAH